MKKKFVLTLALVLMVAVTLTAATPVEVSGSFEFGYDFKFGDGATHGYAGAQKYTTLVSVSSDYWKVNLGNQTGEYLFNSDKPVATTGVVNADIYLDKALADEGVDMGDVGLTLHAGYGIGKKALSVFADEAGYEDAEMYVPVATSAATLGATVKYADLVKVYVATEPIANAFDAIIAASFAPVDGVDAAVGYAVADKLLSVSAAADIAALADLDFDLAASVLYRGDFDGKKNDIFADVAGEYEGIGLYVGFSALDLDQFGIRAGVSYSTEIEGVALGANVDFDMDDLKDTDGYGLSLGANAAYVMGGVKYKLAVGFDLGTKIFTVTPTVGFSW